MNTRLLVMMLSTSLCAKPLVGQSILYNSSSSNLRWFSCDTHTVKLSITDNQLVKASIEEGYWACFGFIFPEMDISQKTQLEVSLKGESETPVKTTTVMFRFKDINGYQTNDGTTPLEKNLLLGNGYQRFYTNFKNHLVSSDGPFDATKVTTLLIFIHFESYMIEEFTGEITVKEARVF